MRWPGNSAWKRRRRSRNIPALPMRCSIYASKPFSLVLLLLSALAAASARFAVHADLRVTAAILLSPPLLVAATILLLRKPIIRVDEKGVAYHPRALPRIVWEDVAGVDRAPLVEPTVDGVVYHGEDGWRPVLVVLRDGDKYLRWLPSALESGLLVERAPRRVCFRIDFTGLSPASAKVYDCIRRHLDAAGGGTREAA